jgi:hypothetical protein
LKELLPINNQKSEEPTFTKIQMILEISRDLENPFQFQLSYIEIDLKFILIKEKMNI